MKAILRTFVTMKMKSKPYHTPMRINEAVSRVGERVLRRFEAMKKSNWSKSIFLVVQAQIGLDKVNPVYIPCIKELLSYPESVGMIGIAICPFDWKN